MMLLVSLVFGIIVGFVIGCFVQPDEIEDTQLLDMLEEYQPDLDVHSGRNDQPRWLCYHPHRYNDYNPHGFPTAREALRDFAEKNTGRNQDDQA